MLQMKPARLVLLRQDFLGCEMRDAMERQLRLFGVGQQLNDALQGGSRRLALRQSTWR